jgi:hypothetical protein
MAEENTVHSPVFSSASIADENNYIYFRRMLWPTKIWCIFSSASFAVAGWPGSVHNMRVFNSLQLAS